jgi:hypothetical protein
MTESSPPPPKNGERYVREEREVRPIQPGILGAMTEISRTILGGMPPGMVIIVVLFCGLIWFLDNQNATRAESMAQRTEAVGKLLDKCISAAVGKPN